MREKDEKNKRIDYMKVLLLIIVIIFVCVIYRSFKANEVHNINEMLKSTQALTNVYYVTQILVSISVVIGAFIGISQYVQSAKIEKYKFDNDRIQKAIDLAEYYKDNILCNMTFIVQVYEAIGIRDIINNVKINQMESFDKDELKEIFSNETFKKINEIMKSEEFYKAVVLIGENHGMCSKNLIKKVIESDEDGKDKVKYEINKGKVHEEFINKVVCETLNNLEYFSMNFIYNTADESTIYQSISKTYLDVVKVLYYNIAINNDAEQKLFTNTIELFNIWKKKSESQKNEIIKFSRGNVSKGKKAKSVY